VPGVQGLRLATSAAVEGETLSANSHADLNYVLFIAVSAEHLVLLVGDSIGAL